MTLREAKIDEAINAITLARELWLAVRNPEALDPEEQALAIAITRLRRAYRQR